MDSLQRSTRRISARTTEKEVTVSQTSQAQGGGSAKSATAVPNNVVAKTNKGAGTKRKIGYNEEDDGFSFSRVKKKKPEQQPAKAAIASTNTESDAPRPQQTRTTNTDPPDNEDTAPKPKTRRKRMSFSSPSSRDAPPPRRSKRLSKDNEHADGSPVKKPAQDEVSTKEPPSTKEPKASSQIHEQQESQSVKPTSKSPKKPSNVSGKKESKERSQVEDQDESQSNTVPTLSDDHSATRIALPVADTPINRKNKAMREGKSGKGERRSSLGSRGRRASSLIESGNSNALPHSEVEVSDYYKHIEGAGLPEPRRMRQLLTWCAERALDEKPIGKEFEDSSARQAARAIEDELLKELSTKSELSDWFNREDLPIPKQPLPERPNPKNVQDLEKMAELQEQIARLRVEKKALESFLRPPDMPLLQPQDMNAGKSLLSEVETAALETISSSSNPTASDTIPRRLNELLDSIGPTIDQFADGVHKIGQYRTAADNLAGRALAICAEKLTERDKEGRKKALSQQDTPAKDLGSVLRSLSRTDQ